MNDQQDIPPHVVFEQLFIEMRRYRDLEHRIVVWWTTILLAIMAAFVGFAENAVLGSWQVSLIGVSFVGALGYVMWRLMEYSNQRYNQLRKKAEKHYYQEAFKLPEMCPSGFGLMTWAMAIITFGFCIVLFVLWFIPARGGTEMDVASVVLVVRTAAYVVLVAKTLGETRKMAEAADSSAEAAREQVEATLAGRAGVLVNDPMTVKQFLGEHNKDGDEPSGKDWDGLNEKWLVIQVTNGGNNTAMNVRLCAKWKCGHESAPSEKTGRMRSACECVRYLRCMVTTPGKIEELEKKEVGTWQVWQLRRDESRFVLMPKPPSDVCEKERDDKHALGLVWWGPGYLKWSNAIILQPPETAGRRWGSNWNRARPLRGKAGHAYWPRQNCGPLPDRE